MRGLSSDARGGQRVAREAGGDGESKKGVDCFAGCNLQMDHTRHDSHESEWDTTIPAIDRGYMSDIAVYLRSNAYSIQDV
jgi:hypothetical protein